jgi:hypothetical protein
VLFLEQNLTQGLLSYDIKATFAAEVLTVAGNTMTTVSLNGEGGSDKRQVVIQIVHSKQQFPSNVSLAYITYVTTVLILLLPEHL